MELDGVNADFGHYYLNYIEELVRYHNAKIIVMKRDKAKVVKSVKAWGWNPYIQKKHNTTKERDKIAESFPFHAKNVDTATHFYYDDYYKEVKRMKDRFTNKMLMVDIEWLNSKENITKIFDFCEIPEKERKVKVGIRENKKFNL